MKTSADLSDEEQQQELEKLAEEEQYNQKLLQKLVDDGLISE
jgi:hypothetical protein